MRRSPPLFSLPFHSHLVLAPADLESEEETLVGAGQDGRHFDGYSGAHGEEEK
jgi:hypothetical protein